MLTRDPVTVFTRSQHFVFFLPTNGPNKCYIRLGLKGLPETKHYRLMDPVVSGAAKRSFTRVGFGLMQVQTL